MALTFSGSSLRVAAEQPASPPQVLQHAHEDGPPLSLKAALDEALTKNPEILALRAQLPELRERRAQALARKPPMGEGTVWRWHINTCEQTNTNMYMFMVGQDLPGRGKRERSQTGRETCRERV